MLLQSTLWKGTEDYNAAEFGEAWLLLQSILWRGMDVAAEYTMERHGCCSREDYGEAEIATMLQSLERHGCC